MKFLLVGAGGVGGLFGAKLAAASHDVTFLCRKGEHLTAMQVGGLELTDQKDDGKVTTVLPRSPGDTPPSGVCATFTDTLEGEDESFDVVIVTTKLHDFGSELLASVSRVLRSDGLVFSLQNGVEATLNLASRLGERVLAAQCYVISFKSGAGKVTCTTRQPQPIAFGERRGSAAFAASGGSASARCAALAEAFEGCGLPASVPDDADAVIWKKFVLSSVYPVFALGRMPFSVGFNDPQACPVLERAMAETVAVAAAHGVVLDPKTVPELVGHLRQLPVAATCSTMRDVAEGKPSEVDGLSGAVIRLGRAVTPAVPTPTHELVCALLSPGERKARGELEY